MKWFPRYKTFPFDFEINVSTIRQYSDQVLPTSLEPGMQPPNTPLGRRNLREELERVRLDKFVQNPLCFDEAFEFVESDEGHRFLREAILPGVRERFFTNGLDFNMLELYFGFEAAFPAYVQGGNLRLIERLLRQPGASIRVNTEVQKVEEVDVFGGRSSLLTSVPTSGGSPTIEQFDTVIVATSLERGNITFEPALPDLPGLEQDYTDSVVCHFTTSGRLNPCFFNWTETMPQTILTTENCNDDSCDQPPFFSLTFLREVLAPGDDFDAPVEHLYKLVSREAIPDSTIEQYLLPPENDPFTRLISWIHREVLPKSVPIVKADREKPCRTLLEDFEIAPRVYYAGGGEQVVAFAEFACRFGENVANLILNGSEECH